MSNRVEEKGFAWLKIEPRVTLGDVVMFLGLMAGGLWAFAAVDTRVTVLERESNHTSDAVVAVSVALETHKRESVLADQQIRGETAEQLRDINAKLDRLIERELSVRK